MESNSTAVQRPADAARVWAEELAANIAAQVWCAPTTSMIEMDSRLAEQFCGVLANWLETYAQEARNTDFYRGIVWEIGDMFGVAARTSDDGSVQDSVLALKVPELVRALLAETQRSTQSEETK